MTFFSPGDGADPLLENSRNIVFELFQILLFSVPILIQHMVTCPKSDSGPVLLLFADPGPGHILVQFDIKYDPVGFPLEMGSLLIQSSYDLFIMAKINKSHFRKLY